MTIRLWIRTDEGNYIMVGEGESYAQAMRAVSARLVMTWGDRDPNDPIPEHVENIRRNDPRHPFYESPN
jgi:hypothetical protein